MIKVHPTRVIEAIEYLLANGDYEPPRRYLLKSTIEHCQRNPPSKNVGFSDDLLDGMSKDHAVLFKLTFTV